MTAAIETTADSVTRTHTLECHCCGQRKPREGFRLLAGRYVSICPECQPKVDPYLVSLEDLRARVDEQVTRFVVGLIRRSEAAGIDPPAPSDVADQIGGMSGLPN